MGNRREPSANRREIRNQLIERRQFHRVDVQLQRLDDLPRSKRVNEYFYTAGIHVNTIGDDGPLQAKIAQFSDMSFVHTIVPEISIVWQRDALSVDRALLLIAREGSLNFIPLNGVIARELHAYLVLPGDQPIQIQARKPGAELIYVSLPSRYIPEPGLHPNKTHALAPSPMQLFAPIYSFVTSLCSLSLQQVTDLSPLHKAAEEIVRAAVRMILGDTQPTEKSLFQRAMEIIVSEHRDKRLRVAMVADRLGVSSRTLQQRFAEEGTTLSQTIREVRGMAAIKLREEQPGLTREHIANLTGFGSVDSLDRAVRLVNRSPLVRGPLEF